MSRGNEEARARRTQADADAFALLSALNSRGRLAPIPNGAIIQSKYKVVRFIRGSDLRNQYVVSWNDESDTRLCWECGFDQNDPSHSQCLECHSDLGGRQFIISERWRINFQPYHEVHEMGLVHPGLARAYDVFEERERLFCLSELLDDGFFVELSSPISGEELCEIAINGCEVLHYLHENGIGLLTLGKEQFVLKDRRPLLLDPDINMIYPDKTPAEQRVFHLAKFGRIMREFVPADAPRLREIFDQAIDGEFDEPKALEAEIRAIEWDSKSAKQDTRAAAMSDVGMARTLNEDNWGWEKFDENISLFAVADGMGGHDGGEVASELAVKTILSAVRRRLQEQTTIDEETLENLLDEAFQEANNTVKGFSEERRSDMGTTLVSLLFYKNQTAFIANVGDSRAYLLRNGELDQISLDHSLVANLVAMGKITKEAARNHPHSNILVRTVGKEWDVEIDIFREEVRPGDTFLLCSDGLWGEVEEHELVELMRGHSEVRVVCQEMIRRANSHGGHDNITALLVNVA